MTTTAVAAQTVQALSAAGKLQEATAAIQAAFTRRDKSSERADVSKRADIDLREIPDMWRKLVEALEETKGAAGNESCVVCQRGDLAPLLPHPTRKCGFLWTLTPSGMRWLRERRKADGKTDVKMQQILADANYDECDIDRCIECAAERFNRSSDEIMAMVQ